MPVTTNMGCDTELTAQKLNLSAPEASFEGVFNTRCVTDRITECELKTNKVVWCDSMQHALINSLLFRELLKVSA